MNIYRFNATQKLKYQRLWEHPISSNTFLSERALIDPLFDSMQIGFYYKLKNIYLSKGWVNLKAYKGSPLL